MITCKKCGNQIQEGNAFCSNCGEPVNTNDEANDKTQIFEGGLIGNNTINQINPEPMISPSEQVNPEPMISPSEQVNPEPMNIPNQPMNQNPPIQSFNNNVSNIQPQNNGIKNNKIIIICAAIAVVVIAAIVLLIPNIGKTTVSCSQEQDQSGVKIKTEIVTDFKNDKVDVITIKGTYTVDDTYKDYIDIFYSSVQEQIKEYEEINGVKTSSAKNGNVISFSVTANRSSAEKLLETEFNGKDETPEAFIKSAEDQGMTCKR